MPVVFRVTAAKNAGKHQQQQQQRQEPPSNAAACASDAQQQESVSLWFRLLTCHAMMLTDLRRQLEDRTTTLARFDLLSSLHREDGQTLAGLSRALLVTAGNVTGLVDRAERDGVVERRPEPSDRRVARVWLTSTGRELIRELLPLHAAQVHQLIGSFGAADRRDLRRLLGNLRAHLTATAGPHAPLEASKKQKRERSTAKPPRTPEDEI